MTRPPHPPPHGSPDARDRGAVEAPLDCEEADIASLDVAIVGPGRLGRTAAALLAGRVDRVRLVGRGQPVPPAQVTWLTVPDSAIALAAREVPPGGVVLHASGATGVEPLRPHAPAGSLHPLMTFPGPELAPPPAGPVPAAVAGDPAAVLVARRLARALGFRPFVVPGDRRLYHAAAVMAGNFATALLGEAASVLSRAGVPIGEAAALLAPLAIASIDNAARAGPRAALTGPAARGDETVIEGHRAALAGLPPHVRATYEALLASTRALLALADEHHIPPR